MKIGSEIYETAKVVQTALGTYCRSLLTYCIRLACSFTRRSARKLAHTSLVSKQATQGEIADKSQVELTIDHWVGCRGHNNTLAATNKQYERQNSPHNTGVHCPYTRID